MILSKFVLNKIIEVLVQKFKIDKMFNYVFDDNELDDKVKNLESRIILLENARLTCNCKKEIKMAYGKKPKPMKPIKKKPTKRRKY